MVNLTITCSNYVLSYCREAIPNGPFANVFIIGLLPPILICFSELISFHSEGGEFVQIEVHILNLRGKERDFPKNGLR